MENIIEKGKVCNGIQIIQKQEFGEIRMKIDENGEPHFCLPDLCRVLQLNTNKVIHRLERGLLSRYPLQTAGGQQFVNFVNEDGMYDTIFDSRKPIARDFRKWVTSEVLPSIRKHGGYIVTKKDDTPEILLERVNNVFNATVKRIEEEKLLLEGELKKSNDKISNLNKRLGNMSTWYFQQKEKRIFFEEQNTNLTKENIHLIGRLNKAIYWYKEHKDIINNYKKNNINIKIGEVSNFLKLPFGRNTLYDKLRECGVFLKNANRPKTDYVNRGFFVNEKNKVFVSQKGINFIENLFKNG